MPACTSETTLQLQLYLERARAGSSSSSSGSEFSCPSSRPSSPADWTPIPQPLTSRLLGWYPALVLRLARQLVSIGLFMAWNKIILSTGLWIVTCLLYIPLLIAKWMLSLIYGTHGLGRTVMITGSSIETLQLARNFYRSGTRVIVLEHDDKFGLARFSTVVDKCFSVPSPKFQLQEYIQEICMIANKENVTYYVPTSTSHSAYYDAVAKQNLEKIGVKCICPGVKEVFMMDDPTSMLQLCKDACLKTPFHTRVTSLEELTSFYEEGQLRRARHILCNSGPFAIRDIYKELELPQTRRGFRKLLESEPKIIKELSASRVGLILEIPSGERLVTCTTIRDGQVVANITCLSPTSIKNHETKYVPLLRDDVDDWLNKLFSALPASKAFSGHLTFTLISTKNGIVPINCRFGMSLPYLCYTNLQPRLIMRPCKHHPPMHHITKENVILKTGRFWLHESLFYTIRSFNFQTIYQFINTLFMKHEMIFVAYDPIPSIIFYLLQAPIQLAYSLLLSSKNKVNHKHFVHFTYPDITSSNGVNKNGNCTKNGYYLNGYNNNVKH